MTHHEVEVLRVREFCFGGTKYILRFVSAVSVFAKSSIQWLSIKNRRMLGGCRWEKRSTSAHAARHASLASSAALGCGHPRTLAIAVFAFMRWAGCCRLVCSQEN